MSQQSSSSPSPKHILVVGAGAVGCFYASKLHHPSSPHNSHVSLVCRSNYKVVAENGVQLKTRDFGDYHFKPYKVFPNIEAAGQSPPEGGKWDYVIVTTKALPDVVDDAAFIQPVVTPGHTAIALIQNGVGIEAPHRRLYPENPVVSCVTVISAEQVEHGVVKQNRWTRISCGPFTNGKGNGDIDGQEKPTQADNTPSSIASLTATSTTAMKTLTDLWTAGGIKDAEGHTETSLQLIRWHKLLINSSFNPSSILSGEKGNAEMVLDPYLRIHVLGCMREISDAIPKILGTPLPSHLATPDKIVKSTERNKGAKPSMLLDWQAGRPLELEVILGNPVRIAEENGVQLPRLQSMYAFLKSAQSVRQEQAKRSKDKAKL